MTWQPFRQGRHRRLALLLVTALLAGCWRQVGFDASVSRNNTLEQTLTAANVVTLAPQWSVPTLGGLFTEPIVPGDGRLYFLRGLDLVAVDAGTGAPVWTRPLTSTPGAFPLGGPVVGVRDELWVGWGAEIETTPPLRRCEGAVERIDPADGSLLETISAAGGPSAIVPAGPHVLVNQIQNAPGCVGSAFLSSFDVGASVPTWESDTPASLVMPVVVGDRIFNGTQVYALGGCGAAVCQPEQFLQLPNDVEGIFTMAGGAGRLFATVQVNTGAEIPSADLVAIDPSTLEVLWRARISDREAGLAVTADAVFVMNGRSSKSLLQAFAAGGCGQPTCSPLWSAPLGDNDGLGQPIAVAGGVVYVGQGGPGGASTGSEVFGFAAGGCGAATCAPLARIDVSAQPRHIIVAAGRLYVDGRGDLQAFAPA